MTLYLQLFFEFFKVGLFAVGGGLATLPFLSDLADKTGWFTHADIANLVAVSESTPGPLGVNMATYVGYHVAGMMGGVIATLGLIAPSIIVIVIVAQFLKKFKENETLQNVFYGLRPASTALIAAAGFEVVKISLLHIEFWEKTGDWLKLVDWKCLLLAAAIYFAIEKWKKHPVVYIAASAVIGIVFQYGV